MNNTLDFRPPVKLWLAIPLFIFAGALLLTPVNIALQLFYLFALISICYIAASNKGISNPIGLDIQAIKRGRRIWLGILIFALILITLLVLFAIFPEISDHIFPPGDDPMTMEELREELNKGITKLIDLPKLEKGLEDGNFSLVVSALWRAAYQASIFGPILESIFFFALMIPYLYSWKGEKMALWGATAIFALGHIDRLPNIVVFLLVALNGFWMAYVYLKTKSIYHIIVIHILWNSFATFIPVTLILFGEF